MGANLSISQRLRVVLRKPLAQYRNGWVLLCACRQCATEAEIPVARLIEAHGRRTVAETIERLRCSRCRQPPAAIVLQSRPSTFEGRVEVVRLRGSGAYA